MNLIQQYSFNDDELTIDWQDGRQSRLAAIWLRDHCQSPQSRDPISGQRLIDITDIPGDIHIVNVTQQENSLLIEFKPGTHRSEFEFDWLIDNCYCLNQQTDNRSEASKHLWTGDSFEQNLPRHSYKNFCSSSDTKAEALQSVYDFGFVLLEDVPCEPGQILEVIGEFGFVRETNYGPLFEVRSEINPNNLAFTNLGLGCHLDNPYRDPVPGLQLLHCLQSSTEGGESILQDGFMAADILRNESRTDFDILSQQWINYRFQDSNTDLHSRAPMIEVNDMNQVVKVRYNNRSIDTIKLDPSKLQSFYTAYRHFAEILQREALQVSFKLNPGELMLFDNTRVLHARKAYSKGGMRHLQGAYSDLDGLYSTLRLLSSNAHKSV